MIRLGGKISGWLYALLGLVSAILVFAFGVLFFNFMRIFFFYFLVGYQNATVENPNIASGDNFRLENMLIYYLIFLMWYLLFSVLGHLYKTTFSKITNKNKNGFS